MKTSTIAMIAMIPLSVTLGGAGGNGCSDAIPSAASTEQQQQNTLYAQMIRNQPPPAFDWSLERHMLIELYKARQRSTVTFSVVQSEYTGKVLWSCPSIGFPIPYATQLTNPQQIVGDWAHALTTIQQQEPNGLFTPSVADATWVPCVDEKGRITPVYEERKVTVFLRPMVERDGKLEPTGAPATISISPNRQ